MDYLHDQLSLIFPSKRLSNSSMYIEGWSCYYHELFLSKVFSSMINIPLEWKGNAKVSDEKYYWQYNYPMDPPVLVGPLVCLPERRTVPIRCSCWSTCCNYLRSPGGSSGCGDLVENGLFTCRLLCRSCSTQSTWTCLPIVWILFATYKMDYKLSRCLSGCK